MTSVVIPAHNEAAVIGRLLSGIRAGARPDEFEIVVVPNGCTDDTAGVAASFGGVRVAATGTASKAAALRLGDEHAVGFPRIYVDADVEVGAADLRALAAAVSEPGVYAAAPERVCALDGRPWTVRWYYEFWQRLPGPRAGLFGRGVVTFGKLAILVVAVQQDILHFLRFGCTHGRPSF